MGIQVNETGLPN